MIAGHEFLNKCSRINRALYNLWFTYCTLTGSYIYELRTRDRKRKGHVISLYYVYKSYYNWLRGTISFMFVSCLSYLGIPRKRFCHRLLQSTSLPLSSVLMQPFQLSILHMHIFPRVFVIACR